MSKEWIAVCSSEDLLADTGVCALVEDTQVAIFRIARDHKLFAIDNFDPIGKANVMSRGMIGSLGEELVVASPLYKQHYSLSTGQCLEEDTCVSVYPVRELEGRVEVALC